MTGRIADRLIVRHDDDLAASTARLPDAKAMAARPYELREMTCAHGTRGSGEHKGLGCV